MKKNSKKQSEKTKKRERAKIKGGPILWCDGRPEELKYSKC
jgi:hypothetical protein